MTWFDTVMLQAAGEGIDLQDMASEAGSLLESGSKSREVMRLRCRQWQEVMGMGYMCVVAEGLRGEPGSWLTRRAACCLIPGVQGVCGRANWASSEADSCRHPSQLLLMLERESERRKK